MTAKTINKQKANEKVEKELLNSLKENDEDQHSQQSGRIYRTNKPL